ncbi:Cholesterol 7-alpha-monooxygenase [Branchiostoma belcheri]|nr:Cholesterol 7-alpha-monooxygenase [Branchiostoma belcheri]
MISGLLAGCLVLVLVAILVQAVSRKRSPDEPPLEAGPLPYLARRGALSPDEPPLESGPVPYLGVALQFAADSLKFIRSRQEKYGDVFTVKLAGKFTTFVLDPHSYSDVMRQHKILDFKTVGMDIVERGFGTTHFERTGRAHVLHTADAYFPVHLQGSALDPLTNCMMGHLQTAMLADMGSETGWKKDGLWSFVRRIISEASFLTIFGRHKTQPVEQERARFMVAMETFWEYDRKFPQVVAGIPWCMLGKAKGQLDFLLTFMHKDQLSQRHVLQLIEQRDEVFCGGGLSGRELAGAHFSTMWASLSNTLPTAFWTLFHLLQDPVAMAAVRKEVETLLKETGQTVSGFRDGGEKIDFTRQQLADMACLETEGATDFLQPMTHCSRSHVCYLRDVTEAVDCSFLDKDWSCTVENLGSVVNEALRVSSVSIVLRQALEETTIALNSGSTFKIRKGDRVALFPQIVHMDPEVYEDPEADLERNQVIRQLAASIPTGTSTSALLWIRWGRRMPKCTFKYDRYLENGKEKTTFYKNGKKLRHYLVPFGIGTSRCPGRFFAVNEIKQFVSLIVCYFDMELVDRETPPLDQSRTGLGILPPSTDPVFRYRIK